MKHQIPEELISAYLDGELTSDEQLLVEEALRDDPQSQQLLEDLQSLHDRLQSIPRSEPSRDYTEQILRRAERAILTGTSETASSDLTSSAPAKEAVAVPQHNNSPGNWKHVIWASTALAATLLLALLFRPNQPISHQLTDATQPQANQNVSTDQPDAESAGESEDNESGRESESPAEPDPEFGKSAEGSTAGFSNKYGPGESVQPKNQPTAAFGDTTATKSAGGPAADANNANNAEELFLYVNLTQKEFDRQTVVRTLLQQQVPFGYDPASAGGLASTANRNNRGLRSELDEVATAEEEKLNALANRKRDQVADKEKGRIASAQKPTARTPANTRVITIEASPQELEQLVVNLSNQYQVELEVENNVDNGFAQQVAPSRQLASPVNRQAVERIQALAIQNNQRRAAATAPAPAGKPAAKPADADDDFALKTAPAVIPPAGNITQRDKKLAGQDGQNANDNLSDSPEQQKANTLRVVVVIEANEITAPAIAARKTSPPAKKKSLKGWELYTWQKDGVTYYSLMLGTNRVKTAKEISDASVKGTAAIQAKLDQLQKGELVLVHGRDPNTKASAAITKELAEYCKKIGLETR